MPSTRKPGQAVGDQLGHRAAGVGDDRRAACHRLDDAVAERLVEVDEVQEGVGAAEHGCAVGGGDRSEVADAVAVDVRGDLLVEVALVLDDAGDDEAAAGRGRDLDGVGGALVGVDPPEEEQVIARARG